LKKCNEYPWETKNDEECDESDENIFLSLFGEGK
jgi:hypothetical protein